MDSLTVRALKATMIIREPMNKAMKTQRVSAVSTGTYGLSRKWSRNNTPRGSLTVPPACNLSEISFIKDKQGDPSEWGETRCMIGVYTSMERGSHRQLKKSTKGSAWDFSRGII